MKLCTRRGGSDFKTSRLVTMKARDSVMCATEADLFVLLGVPVMEPARRGPFTSPWSKKGKFLAYRNALAADGAGGWAGGGGAAKAARGAGARGGLAAARAKGGGGRAAGVILPVDLWEACIGEAEDLETAAEDDAAAAAAAAADH
jgi:hypothetical protein